MSQGHDPYLALRQRDFRLFLGARMLIAMASLVQEVAVGWQLYDRTHSALALGMTGLVSVTPTILFALYAGTVADRYDRRHVARLGQLLAGGMSLWLAALAYTHGAVWMIYVALFLSSAGFAFSTPAQAALLAQLLPGEAFANGVTWSSAGFQIAAVTGPALSGVLIALAHGGTTIAYIVCAGMAAVYIGLMSGITPRLQARMREPVTLRTLVAGLRFVFDDELILAALTLDLFAVLFGGATTLLPIYAKDILHVGPTGLGWLRAAPSFGAMLTALWLAHRRPMRHAGKLLLTAVAGFGVATIVFGASRSFPLSIAALFATGAFDSVSVVIRSSLVQLRTPDAMRGRVSAVNSIFIDLSNEFGGFESGTVAALVGPVKTVVAGGIGTILIVIGVGAKWKALREMRQLGMAADQQ